MIRTWANRASERFYTDGKNSPFRGLDVEAAQDLLAALDAARSLQDLSPLKSVGLHKLKGDRAGQWAMTINDRWRICFRFKDGDAYAIQITVYIATEIVASGFQAGAAERRNRSVHKST